MSAATSNEPEVVSFEPGTDVSPESVGYELRLDPNAQVGVDEKRFNPLPKSVLVSCVGMVLVALSIPVTSARVSSSLGVAGVAFALISAFLWFAGDWRPRKPTPAHAHEIRAMTRPVPVMPWTAQPRPPAPRLQRSSYARFKRFRAPRQPYSDPFVGDPFPNEWPPADGLPSLPESTEIPPGAEGVERVVGRPSRPALEIDVGGTRVRCQVGDDIEYVAALVRALQSRE